MRLHTRVIIRDRRQMFIGSQSLRELELDARREIGIIVPDRKVISSVIKVFEEDWNSTAAPKKEVIAEQAHETVSRTAKRVAKAIAKELPPVGPVVDRAIKEVTREDSELDVDEKEVE